MIAALFVDTRGAYSSLPGVDPWDVARDARLYAGPHSVVAHPPCERWGAFWFGSPSQPEKRYQLGDDGGCFAAALKSARSFGGVLEHPAGSKAWAAFNLNAPPREGGWIAADFLGGWTCCVEQGHYGHRARKATWLYVSGVRSLPSLIWGPSVATIPEGGVPKRGGPRRAGVEMMGHEERRRTPVPFRDLLIGIARSASAVESRAA